MPYLLLFFVFLLKNDNIHKNTIAPTTDTTSVPIIPPNVRPNRPKRYPPKTEPINPTKRFIIRPKPPPLIILPAKKPAIIPIIIEPIIPISIINDLI